MNCCAELEKSQIGIVEILVWHTFQTSTLLSLTIAYGRRTSRCIHEGRQIKTIPALLRHEGVATAAPQWEADYVQLLRQIDLGSGSCGGGILSNCGTAHKTHFAPEVFTNQRNYWENSENHQSLCVLGLSTQSFWQNIPLPRGRPKPCSARSWNFGQRSDWLPRVFLVSLSNWFKLLVDIYVKLKNSNFC